MQIQIRKRGKADHKIVVVNPISTISNNCSLCSSIYFLVSITLGLKKKFGVQKDFKMGLG